MYTWIEKVLVKCVFVEHLCEERKILRQRDIQLKLISDQSQRAGFTDDVVNLFKLHF